MRSLIVPIDHRYSTKSVEEINHLMYIRIDSTAVTSAS